MLLPSLFLSLTPPSVSSVSGSCLSSFACHVSAAYLALSLSAGMVKRLSRAVLLAALPPSHATAWAFLPYHITHTKDSRDQQNTIEGERQQNTIEGERRVSKQPIERPHSLLNTSHATNLFPVLHGYKRPLYLLVIYV